MEKDLMEAVERVKTELEFHESCNHDLRELSFGNDIHTLIDLAESYLSIQGFPEEKKSGKCYSSCSLCPYQKECPIDEKNKLIETMKLALLKKMDVYELAKFLHIEYENSARLFGWGSQEVCRVPFDELPEANKKTMLSVAEKLKDHLTK